MSTYVDVAEARIAATLYALLRAKIADRSSLWRHPALMRVRDVAGSGSDTVKVSSANDAVAMSAIADGTEGTVTALDLSSGTVVVARHYLAHSLTDLASLVAPSPGFVDLNWLADKMLLAAELAFTGTIGGLQSAWTNTVGATGTPLDVDTFLAASFGLTEKGVPGEGRLSVMHSASYGELALDASTVVGAAEHRSDMQNAADSRSIGAQAVMWGVAIHTTNRMTAINADADWANGMFGANAIAYAEGSLGAVAAFNGLLTLPAGTVIMIDKDRNGLSGTSTVTGSYFYGASIASDDQDGGVQLISQKI